MVLDYYSLTEQPFGVTPDPRFLYMGPAHREAMASLLYGIQSYRGFMSLIARPGMGKTSILFHLLNEVDDSFRTVFLFQTLCGPEELLRSLLHDLGVRDEGGSIVCMHAKLNHFLLAEVRQGRKIVVVVDEAQNLQDDALELLRMLSNFETRSKKLLQIVLCGQPQLREKLGSPQLEQLRQRISICTRLNPLDAAETQAYIDHRLQVAGYSLQTPLFSPEAVRLIAKSSEGIPRNINNICFNALSIGYVLKQKTIQKDVIHEVLEDLDLNASIERVHQNSERRQESTFFAKNFFTAVKSPQAWVRAFALCTALVLLAWPTRGARNTNVLGFRPLPVVRAASPVDQLGPAFANLDLIQPVESKPEFTTQSHAALPANKALVTPQPVPASPQKSVSQSTSRMAPASDIATLWSQVKYGSTAAEVELARIYLDGTAVPRNCDQAQILLSAASRKGSKNADELLTRIDERCR